MISECTDLNCEEKKGIYVHYCIRLNVLLSNVPCKLFQFGTVSEEERAIFVRSKSVFNCLVMIGEYVMSRCRPKRYVKVFV